MLFDICALFLFAMTELRLDRSAYFDNQYNNRLRVPDFVSLHFEPWQRRSQQWRESCAAGGPYSANSRFALNVEYTSNRLASESLDVFSGPGENRPVLFFIHGGYWRSLDKSDFSFVAKPFVEQGFTVVVSNYALCPQVRMPQICLQQSLALAWTWEFIEAYGGDPDNLTVVGHSAGGHLAAMMLACHWRKVAPHLPENLVTKAMSLSGLHELDSIRECPYLQTDLRLTSEEARACSPAYFAAPQGRHLIALCGAEESEEFQRQNQLIASAWGAQIVRTCEAVPGRNHFSILDALCDSTHRVHQLCRALVAKS